MFTYNKYWIPYKIIRILSSIILNLNYLEIVLFEIIILKLNLRLSIGGKKWNLNPVSRPNEMIYSSSNYF